jgi:hypothetical protein
MNERNESDFVCFSDLHLSAMIVSFKSYLSLMIGDLILSVSVCHPQKSSLNNRSALGCRENQGFRFGKQYEAVFQK